MRLSPTIADFKGPNMLSLLLQNYPDHVVGRFSMAIISLFLKANYEAASILEPAPKQLGPLGLFKGLQAVVASLTRVDGDVAQV